MPDSLISVNFMLIVLAVAAVMVIGCNILAAIMNAILRIVIKAKGL